MNRVPACSAFAAVIALCAPQAVTAQGATGVASQAPVLGTPVAAERPEVGATRGAAMPAEIGSDGTAAVDAAQAPAADDGAAEAAGPTDAGGAGVAPVEAADVTFSLERVVAAIGSGRAFGYSGRLRAAVVLPPRIEEPASAPEATHQVLGVAAGAATPEPADAVGAAVGRPAPPAPSWIPLYEVGAGPEILGEPVRSTPTAAPSGPGIYLVEYGSDELGPPRAFPLAVITTVPFSEKRGGYLNGYHIGRYPVEGSGRTDRYAPPIGFIEVTEENQDFAISEHFRLRQFLTKDQGDVWPKYLALDLRLVDKLELVLQELNAMGVRADAMHVMSGFRTPQYNGPGGDGRATLSRHTYGDAADVWVDSDGDGYMDDLNGDGRADIQDARVMLRAVERVERRYPELVGGAGVYVANSAHGPFIHIDVRGSPARW